MAVHDKKKVLPFWGWNRLRSWQSLEIERKGAPAHIRVKGDEKE